MSRFSSLARLPGSAFFRAIVRPFLARCSRLAPASLANRIFLLQVVWTFFIYVVVIAALWFATSMVITSHMRQQGEDWIGKFDQMGMPIYAANNPARLKQAIGYVKNFPEIAHVRYLDETGSKIIAEYARAGRAPADFAPLPDAAIKRLRRTDVAEKPMLYETGADSLMRISAPIWIKSIANDGMIDFSLDKASREKIKTIGFIEVVLDYGPAMHNLDRNIFGASLIIALTMLGAAFVMRLMVRRALKPLSELEEPLTRLANGETDVTVNATGDKEIARIGVALNTTISALKARDETLRQMAVRDSLTGLVNRAYFVDRLEQEIRRVGRGGGSAALFFFDLDRFKKINDTYGHAAGDRLLVQVTRQLGQRVRDNDLLARYGGDEFTLLACDVDATHAAQLADAFLSLMRDFSFYESGDMIRIQFSIGVTMIDDGTLTTQHYLNEADAAAHQAKRNGRNCFRMFERETHRIGEQTGWYEHLQGVLAGQQSVLHYQPLTSLQQERADTLYEVLLRLPDKNRHLVGPAIFMPAAERFGLTPDFDRQVIGKAAQQLSHPDMAHTVFSVNLSEQFFGQDDIQEFLAATVVGAGADPGRFVFELSQRYVVRNIDRLRAILATLAQQGYRFAIDDFGADFGSFNYVRDLPVHFLKIDGSLIEHIATDKIARTSVRAIVEVASTLNLATVAKNVPDEQSLAALRELGVDYAQGNYLSPPSAQLSGVAAAA